MGASLRVDLEAVVQNFLALRRIAAGAEVAPVLKADAYGLGAEAIAPRLHEAGARRFFVARLEEGLALRRRLAARAAEILVLDGLTEGASSTFAAARLTPVLNSPAQVERHLAAGRGLAGAALHVDTGLNRLGLRPEEAQALAARRPGAPDLLISHLACAGDPGHPLNRRQADLFAEVRGLFPDAPASLANTEATRLLPDLRLDLVRPGIGLFGGGPADPGGEVLRTAALYDAPILQVRRVRAGESVGYGATFVAREDLDVAVLAAGHADGVLRAAGGGGYGWFAGRRRPFLGRLSMDLLALDVTGCAEAREGARVELFGPNLPVAEAAAAAGVTPYELLARSDRRRRTIAALG